MPGSFIWTNDQSGQYCPSYSRYTQHLSSSQDIIIIIIIALVVIVLVSIIAGVIAYYRFIGIAIVIIFVCILFSESRFHSVNINLC